MTVPRPLSTPSTPIAMAFLEGEGLDKKIESGPLKLKDALETATGQQPCGRLRQKQV